MSQYFLIKEQEYTDGAVTKTDISLIYNGVGIDNYDEAVKEAQKYAHYPSDIVYVVEVVAKCWGGMKINPAITKIKAPRKLCDECGWPEHEGRCGVESLQK